MSRDSDARAAFMKSAVWHGSLDAAEALLARHPELRRSDIFTAAILGDAATVRHFLEHDPAAARLRNGPYDAEPLVCLCLSKYLRLDHSRSDEFLRAATALLDAGADPNAGFMWNGELETALYGAAGVAHHAQLTQLLLDRGAMPDGEVAYHAAEEYDLGAMKALVLSGKMSDDDLTTLLVRKIDWHDEAGVRWLLERGVPSDRVSHWGFRPLAHAIRRDNALATIELLLDHGADATSTRDGQSGVAMAARAGRSDVLQSLAARGVSLDLQGVERLIAACALGEAADVRAIVRSEPRLMQELHADGAVLMAAFVGSGNLAGVRQLLAIGVPVAARWTTGDGYWGIAPDSLPIHVAAWRARHRLVDMLIAHGSPVNIVDGKGQTPLMLAVRACVDSYWTEGRSPDSVAALLRAGATPEGVRYPCGYADVDALLAEYGATTENGGRNEEQTT